jgi:hypothetical protein
MRDQDQHQDQEDQHQPENQQEQDEQAEDEQAEDEQAEDEAAEDEQAEDEEAEDEQPEDEQAEDEQAEDEQDQQQPPSATAIEEAKRYIAQEKEAQNARRMNGPQSDGHNIRIFAIVSAWMNQNPNKIFKMDELEVAVQLGGHKFSNTGPAMAYAIRAGLVERVGRGFYRLLPAGRVQSSADTEQA